MWKTIISLFSFLIIISCCPYKISKTYKERWQEDIESEYAFPEREIPKIKVIDFPEKGFKAAIFPKEYTVIRGLGSKYFTPTRSDIEEAELLLKKSNIENNVTKNYSDFNRRQYIGSYSDLNEKTLTINFLSIKNKCQEKSSNAYLFDKYFLDVFHPDDEERQESFILNEDN